MNCTKWHRSSALRRYARTETGWEQTVIADDDEWATLTWAVTVGAF